MLQVSVGIIHGMFSSCLSISQCNASKLMYLYSILQPFMRLVTFGSTYMYLTVDQLSLLKETCLVMMSLRTQFQPLRCISKWKFLHNFKVSFTALVQSIWIIQPPFLKVWTRSDVTNHAIPDTVHLSCTTSSKNQFDLVTASLNHVFSTQRIALHDLH